MNTESHHHEPTEKAFESVNLIINSKMLRKIDSHKKLFTRYKKEKIRIFWIGTFSHDQNTSCCRQSCIVAIEEKWTIVSEQCPLTAKYSKVDKIYYPKKFFILHETAKRRKKLFQLALTLISSPHLQIRTALE